MKLKKENEKLYYLEHDKVVFTPEYHMARGYCCGNKCRHCPYQPKYIKDNTQLETLWQKTNQQNIKN